jgi:hypothetical protein
MNWHEIEKLVDSETEKKARDFSLLNNSLGSSSSFYNSNSTFGRSAIQIPTSPPSFDRFNRSSPRESSFSRFSSNNQLERTYGGYAPEVSSEDPNSSSTTRTSKPSTPTKQLTPPLSFATRSLLQDSNNSNLPNPPPPAVTASTAVPSVPLTSTSSNNSSMNFHSQLSLNDEILELKQLFFQNSHRLNDLEETLSRSIESQHQLQINRTELIEKNNIYEQEIKTLKTAYYKLMKENEGMLVSNHKLQVTVDNLQSKVEKQTENSTSKETIIKFIDSTIEQMRILQQNSSMLTSKNNEISLLLDQVVLTILDLPSNNNSNGNNNSQMINQTYQILKNSSSNFSDQIKSMISSSLTSYITSNFQSSLKPFQENITSVLNIQLKEFKEKSFSTLLSSFSELKNSTSNEITILKNDMISFKHGFDEYKNIQSLLTSINGKGGAGGGGSKEEKEEETNTTLTQMKEKQQLFEKTISDLQTQQKSYHTILTNQNEILTNNTNLSESSRLYYENCFKQLSKDYTELEKKFENTHRSYQSLKEELISENWTNQNKIIKDLSDRNLLITSQMNQMKTGSLDFC